MNAKKVKMNTSEWVHKLWERLDVLRGMARKKAEKESQQMKMSYDRGKVLRTYKVEIWSCVEYQECHER